MKHCVPFLTLLFLLLTVPPSLQSLTLQQYEQLEKQTPQLIFEEIVGNFSKQQTPNIDKLMFTTPWSKTGNELVIRYAHKFDYVSPCWYDLTFNYDRIIIENDKHYNETFIKSVKKSNKNIKILPRFYLPSNEQTLLHSIASFEAKFRQTISLIKQIIEKHKFDGLVWDSPFNTMLIGEKYQSIRNLIVKLVNSLKTNLPSNKLLFFNMANPMGLSLANEAYALLNVDCIMIQNYDNNNYLQMIKSSLAWSKSTKFQAKPSIMLLLPFFSRRGGQGIDTKQIQQIYRTEGQLGTNIQNGVCSFYQYGHRIQSYVPCYVYFKKVFSVIERNKYSVGFWEAGNGLENYYYFL